MGNILEKLTARLSRGGIRSAMFASFTISALLAVVLTSVTLYVRFSAQLDAAIEEENQMLVEQVNQSLSTYLRDMIRLSDSICYNVVKNTDLDREPVSEEMRLLYNTYSDYVENMVLFTGDGQVVATAPAARVRADAESTSAPWFTSAMERTENLHFGIPAVQTLFEDAGHNYKRVVSLSCAVELTQGGDTQLGVLLIDLKYSALTALFQSVKLSGSGYLYLTAGDGALIYHPERPLIASGLVHESNLDAAGRPDGIYTETWEGRRRSVIVQAVGYTGWKVVGVVDLIQSVDRMELLQCIEKEAEKKGLIQDILLEVNVGGEASKSGFTVEEARQVAAQMAQFPSVHLRGLMAIPPVSQYPGENCKYFAEMRKLFVDISEKTYDNVSMECLSMGMTDDFADAIAEGSTMIRVGTAIFGPRNYQK